MRSDPRDEENDPADNGGDSVEPTATSAGEQSHADPWQYAGDTADAPSNPDDETGDDGEQSTRDGGDT